MQTTEPPAPRAAPGIPDNAILTRHREHWRARAAEIDEHCARVEQEGYGLYSGRPEPGDLERFREHTRMMRSCFYAARDAARAHQLATTPRAPRSEPTDPPRPREVAARALAGAARRVATASSVERMAVLEWALRKPGREALRSGWDRSSVAELLAESAATAGMEAEVVRLTIDRELEQ